MLYDLHSVKRNLWWELSFFDFQIHFQRLVKVDIIMQNFLCFIFTFSLSVTKEKAGD